MIVTCPNCGARYRLQAAPAPGARMRCAECDHRWIAEDDAEPVTAAAPDRAPPAETPPASAAPPAEPASPPPAVEPRPDYAAADTPEAPPEPPRPRPLATLAAVIVGAGLLLVAAGLWLGDRAPGMLAQLPGIGEAFARAPAAPLTITVQGHVSDLPPNQQLLEVTGTLTNPTAAPLAVPPLQATLSGPDGVALRWTIPAPVAVLPAGHQTGFTSTVTGFPRDATHLEVRSGR